MSDVILVDDPAPHVRRITINRPEKRNALNYAVMGGLLDALRAGDADDDVNVQIIRGAGSCFSAGYDLGGGNDGLEPPSYVSGGDGQWPRRVTEQWMSIWDLAKPVIAQVHGYCLAGGSELATGCDLVYVAEDAQIGYPAVRFGVPDMQYWPFVIGMRAAMEFVLTGDALSGTQAVALGWANRAYPVDQLETEVLRIAERIAKIPTDIGQINKRTVHRAMENMGLRNAIRNGTELCALGTKQETLLKFVNEMRGGLTDALQKRDKEFGDYRTSEH